MNIIISYHHIYHSDDHSSSASPSYWDDIFHVLKDSFKVT